MFWGQVGGPDGFCSGAKSEDLTASVLAKSEDLTAYVLAKSVRELD